MSPVCSRFALVSAAGLLLGLLAICDDAHAMYPPAPDRPDAAVDTDAARCRRYDTMQPQGTTNPSISTCETLSPGLGGLRSKLADSGWMVQGGTTFGGTFDLLNHGAHPQLYIGQNSTYRADAFAYLTYDLTRLGFAGESQLVLNTNVQAFSYAGENPTGFAINSLYISQRFNGGREQL